jgi:hypothetical protein
MPPRTGLSDIQSSTINDPEGPEKYNNTKNKNGQMFYNCHTALNNYCCKNLKKG